MHPSVTVTHRLTAADSTPHALRRLRTALVVLVVVALAGGLTTFLGAQSTARAVDEDVVPTTGAVSAVWTQLRDLDGRFTDCGACPGVLAGGEHHAVVADAVQRLGVLAQRPASDDADRQLLQVVQGLLIRYLALLEQAGVAIGRGQPLLAEAHLRYAHDLLDGSVLVELAEFRGAVRADLRAQRTSGWRQPATALLWIVPVLVCLALLVLTQRYLASRFRRRLNVPLAAATVGLAVMAVGIAQPWWGAADDFRRATRGLTPLVGPGNTPPPPPSAALVADAARAADGHSLPYLLVGLAVVLVALIAVGVQRRIDEYGGGA
ncbi:hypothetical protein Val02_18520 [Virgisporangium aliadipatigenens]|uniref:Uncharacterized protein n=1 Tax=Virgisporangium aliadipatigenens TaxID=741659 RepID=A0A8J4DPI4_9ACTN|nr:hypothetical protein [Virgisporangium aliadipatigenens]GIJ44966.1 hypothetical protein Val02_18520 [Virgisporangium aliadipatigenens]